MRRIRVVQRPLRVRDARRSKTGLGMMDGVARAAPFLFCSGRFPRIAYRSAMSFGFFRNLTKPKPSPVEEREHVVAGRTLPLRIVESARARRLTLRIDSGGQGLRITVPPGLRRGE